MRLIDAKTAEKNIRTAGFRPCDIGIAIRAIREAPTIEAEPVKHGRWEHIRMLTTGDGRVKVGDCSSCNSTEKVRNYCPNCGAKMDLEVT